MAPKIEPFWEGYITALSDAKYSYSEIIKQCKRRGFTISKKGVSCVLNKKDNARLGLIPQGKKQANPRPATSCTPEIARKVKSLVSGPNPATQRAIALKLGISITTVDTTVDRDLNLKSGIKPSS